MADNTPVTITIRQSRDFLHLKMVEAVLDCGSSGGILASGGDSVRLLASDFGLDTIDHIGSIDMASAESANSMLVPVIGELYSTDDVKVADAFLKVYAAGAEAAPSVQANLTNIRIQVFGNPGV